MLWRLSKIDNNQTILENKQGKKVNLSTDHLPSNTKAGDQIEINLSESDTNALDEQRKKDIINSILQSKN